MHLSHFGHFRENWAIFLLLTSGPTGFSLCGRWSSCLLGQAEQIKRPRSRMSHKLAFRLTPFIFRMVLSVFKLTIVTQTTQPSQITRWYRVHKLMCSLLNKSYTSCDSYRRLAKFCSSLKKCKKLPFF